jgi:protein-tyrosine phosphatase
MSYIRLMAYRISCVCLGNICRSPMAEAVLRERITEAGLADLVILDSAGTGTWHIGEDMDHRARQTLETNGYVKHHVAQQITEETLPNYDLVLAMDLTNRADLLALASNAPGPTGEVRLFRSFDSEAEAEAQVPDPYFGGTDGFNTVLHMAERAADGVVEYVIAKLGRGLEPVGS